MAEVGERYADPASPGRVVQIVEVLTQGYVVETVVAADDAVSSRAVGKLTAVSEATFRRFKKCDD